VLPGLGVVKLTWGPGAVIEHAQHVRVLVGQGHAEGVGVVPAPHHLVIQCPSDDPGGIEVVGEHVVDVGGDHNRHGLNRIRSNRAQAGGRQLDGGVEVRRRDGLQPQVDPGIVIAALI